MHLKYQNINTKETISVRAGTYPQSLYTPLYAWHSRLSTCKPYCSSTPPYSGYMGTDAPPQTGHTHNST